MKNYYVVKIPRTAENEQVLSYLKTSLMENTTSGVVKACLARVYNSLTKYKSEKHINKVSGTNLTISKQAGLCLQLPNGEVDEVNQTCTFLTVDEISGQEHKITRPLGALSQDYVNDINRVANK